MLLRTLRRADAALRRGLEAVGPGDRGKLDEYMDSVRDIEQRIQTAEKAGKAPPVAAKGADERRLVISEAGTVTVSYDEAERARTVFEWGSSGPRGRTATKE